MACSFNLEYLLVGGRDARQPSRPIFMWYDWMAGGWGGRNGRDGANATSPIFGVGLAVQPVEGQERLSPGGHLGPRDHDRLGRPGTLPRRLRRREGRPADRGRGHRHVVLLRPRPVDHVGHRGRPAVAAARRVAQPAAATTNASSAPSSPTCPIPAGVVVHAAVGRRRRLRRPAGARPGPGGRGRRRRLRVGRARRARLRRRGARRSTPSWRSTRSTRPRPRRCGPRCARLRRGWLAEDAGRRRAPLPRRRARRARPRAPLRRDRRLGHRRAARAHDGGVQGDARPPGRRVLADDD